jgi:hypothetical protein
MTVALKGEIRDVIRWFEANDGSANVLGWNGEGAQILSAFKKWVEIFAGESEL